MATSLSPLLRVTGLQKSYSVPVLIDFHFELRPGEVHALIGSNGAGKSTFARILSGLTPRDGGEVLFADRPFASKSKREAEHAGVVMVHQELNVIGTLSVAENIFLNDLPRRGGFVQYFQLHKQARQALARVGLDGFDPATPAGQLGVGHQQLVEIAGALAKNCRLLILDEPTAALTGPEVERLFENLRRLRSEGVGIIYISHRMDEIRRIADRITVMRDGHNVAAHSTAGVTSVELVREMAGHDLPKRDRASRSPTGEPVLKVQDLRSGDAVRGVDLEVRAGEVVGIAGLIGSGRTETLRAIFGADPRQSGEIHLRGKQVMIRSPEDAVRAGIGLVPEDRKQDGLLLPQSIRVNTTLATLSRHSRFCGWIDRSRESKETDALCRRLQVRSAGVEQQVAELSGGNQQKVMFARWLARDCAVLLFDEPTRGIDAAAKDAIYALVRELAGEGKAIVVVSSELEELTLISDRILVMSAGRILAEFTPENWSEEKITQAAFSGYLDQSPR